MKKLNKQQRKFLEYIKKNHNSIGWNITVPRILDDGEYEIHEIGAVLADWDLFVKNPKSITWGTGNTDSMATLEYGIPKHYLK